MNKQQHWSTWLTVPSEQPFIFRRVFVWVIHIFLFACSGVAAFLLRFDFNVPPRNIIHLMYGIPIWIVVKTMVFRLQGLDHGWWRYVSIADASRIAIGNIVGSTLSAIVILLFVPPRFPRSIYFLDFLVCFVLIAGIRVFTRVVADAVVQRRQASSGKRVLIYGAGSAGITLIREIRANPKLPYSVCGIIDDNPHKKGMLIQGVPVLGRGSDLPFTVSKHDIQEVLIALPSATGEQITAILRYCHEAGVQCKTIPSLAEIIDGGLASHIREIAVEDLLGRIPVNLEEDQISTKLFGRIVLVTGAAGSIGSELCRQIARFSPAAIVAYEMSESALFHLDRQMRLMFPNVPFLPEIGSVQNHARLAEVFECHKPSVVYHAAAYKHVPLMEMHVFEAVENNILGTEALALAAARYGVNDLVMISSDKAVRPTSIMGTTKRVAELLIHSLQDGGTRYVSVRFGNVLGSNGSVIPIFKEQIAAGGPVTVTHPDMQRYFMTIPEAAQLVLQASTMGRGGEIFVLDMGSPVKIVDLAHKLIFLSGLRPGKDIQIEFTGVRPGEKLFEELSNLEEDTVPTHHDKIKIFTGPGIPYNVMKRHLASIREICARRDLTSLVQELTQIVPDYNPDAQLLRRAHLDVEARVFHA